METAAAFRASFGNLLTSDWAARSGSRRLDLRVGARLLLGESWVQRKLSSSHTRFGSQNLIFSNRKRNVTKASMQPSDSDSSQDPIAPLQLESPVGQFLSQILMTHPQLLPAAVEHQLEQLHTDREAGKSIEEPSASGTELVLYRRIAEVRANERRKTLEEILYAMVVQRFMDAGVPLISSITPSPDSSSHSNTWISKDVKIEKLHSPEAYEMIENHLALILGNRIGVPDAVAQISKLRVGQVYAASIMYGYFLRRVDERFQLEKTMKILPPAADSLGDRVPGGDESLRNAQPHPEMAGVMNNGASPGMKPSRLRAYLMSFDVETIQRYTTIRSKEAISMIEKHTEALFGRPEIFITPEGSVDPSKDETIRISFSGLKRLVLEAVTFGSFLWDVESFVDSRYHFVLN